jgi:hypothetical protein
MENNWIDIESAHKCVHCKGRIVERFVLETTSGNDGRVGGMNWSNHTAKSELYVCPNCDLIFKFPPSQQSRETIEDMAYEMLAKNNQFRLKEDFNDFKKDDVVYETVTLHSRTTGSVYLPKVDILITKEPKKGSISYEIPKELLEEI